MDSDNKHFEGCALSFDSIDKNCGGGVEIGASIEGNVHVVSWMENTLIGI